MMKASIKLLRVAGSLIVLGLLGPLVTGCTATNSTETNAKPPVYVLSLTSIAGLHETITSVSPADTQGVSSGTTGLQLSYNPGTTVTVTANPVDTNGTGGAFLGWCDASSTYSSPFTCAPPPCSSVSGLTCTLTMNSNVNLVATYPGVTGVTITPYSATDIFPATQQFTITVNGLGTYLDSNGNPQPYQGSPYMPTLSGPSTFTTSLGTISTTGLYTPPYPVPASVTLKATSTVVPTESNLATIIITVPTQAAGPGLTVDVGSPTHAISPDIYGINDYGLDASIPAAINLPIERWGGDATTRYNYLVDADNSAGDYYFETNFNSANTTYPLTSQFNSQVTQDRLTKTATLATVPLIGYTTQRIAGACSYSVKKYGAQTSVDVYNPDCGTGILVTAVNGSTTVKNDPTDTSVAIDQTFDSGWVQFLVGQFGTAANGGVAVYGLDNEPEYWSAVHKDVHPVPFTYDELSTKGIAYAAALKSQDPTALVSGPVISSWTDYFYSATDIADGYASSPSCPQANPQDRIAHGDVPLMDYYLQQFAAYDAANGQRLLDYVDLHTYFAAPGAAFATTGSIALQQARLNSTRVFWDPTYTDPNYTDPTDTSTTRSCQGQPYAPNLINLEKTWVANDYPGTKLGITEYNWGGQEAINGALAQADILGIFGREGLDLGVLWGPPKPTTSNGVPQQLPGIIAFEVFTNYDGKGSQFGNTAVTSTSANQGLLAIYGATRSSDGALTMVVINKGYVDLTAAVSLPNLTSSGPAQAFLYSAANLTTIVTQPSVAIAPAASGNSASVSTVFPAQSITLLVIPK